jgi:hypothetical protein
MGGEEWNGMECDNKKRKRDTNKMKNTKADKLLRVLKRIEKLTRPEGDELGYSNSSLIDIVMATYSLASSAIEKETKTK